jgi:hypothetical protein
LKDTKMPDHLEGRTDKAPFPGTGQSRSLQTQSGQTVALCQETMMQEGGVYTCTFDVIPPTDEDGDMLPFAATAQIRWNENGNSIQRIISIVQGTSISLPGRVVDIRVTDVTPELLPISGDPTPGAGSKYTVSVVIDRGMRPSKSYPPTLYSGIATFPPATAVTIPIPLKSGVDSLEVTAVEDVAFPTVKPNIVVSFQNGTGIFKQYDPSVTPGFVPIPPGATDVVITNADPTNATNITLTWGVDG